MLLVILGALLLGLVGVEQYRKMTAPIVPNFRSKTIDGGTFDLAEHRGKRPVVLDFYATWCGPCQMELPHLIKLAKEYGDRVQVVVLSDEPAEVLKRQPELSSASVTVLPNARPIFDLYKIQGIPHIWFFDAAGEVYDLEGYSDEASRQMDEQIKKSLATQASPG
jgi:thiol-disulfide isomerase/thioredoxin